MSNVMDTVKMVMSMDKADLNKVVEAVRFRRSQLETMSRLSFSVGDKVEFDSRKGMTVTGKIKKINRKTIIVDATDMRTWRVSPSLLRRAKAA